MDKQQITRELNAEYGSFVSVTEVAEYLRVDRSTARKWMYGVSYLPCGTKKLYHVNDIAERLMQLRGQ